MDFLCNECAKSSAKEVDLVIHQSRAHDKRHFSCEVCQENFIGKDKHRNHMRKHNKKKETPKKSTYVHLALTKHHTNGTSSNMSRHMTKKRFMGHPSSALNVENHACQLSVKLFFANRFCVQ